MTEDFFMSIVISVAVFTGLYFLLPIIYRLLVRTDDERLDIKEVKKFTAIISSIVTLIVFVNLVFTNRDRPAYVSSTSKPIVINNNSDSDVPVEESTPTSKPITYTANAIPPNNSNTFINTSNVLPSATPTKKPVDYFVYTKTPESDTFYAVGYHEVNKQLEVCFNSTGVYTYFDVPKSVYDEFISASSLGSYFNEHIKGVYRYEKGTEQDTDFIHQVLDEEDLNDIRNDWVSDYSDEVPEGYDAQDYFNDNLEEIYDFDDSQYE